MSRATTTSSGLSQQYSKVIVANLASGLGIYDEEKFFNINGHLKLSLKHTN